MRVNAAVRLSGAGFYSQDHRWGTRFWITSADKLLLAYSGSQVGTLMKAARHLGVK